MSNNTETTILRVSGMHCQHCAKAVREAVTGVPGVLSADVDLDAETVTILHEGVAIKRLRAAIAEAGYAPE